MLTPFCLENRDGDFDWHSNPEKQKTFTALSKKTDPLQCELLCKGLDYQDNCMYVMTFGYPTFVAFANLKRWKQLREKLDEEYEYLNKHKQLVHPCCISMGWITDEQLLHLLETFNLLWSKLLDKEYQKFTNVQIQELKNLITRTSAKVGRLQVDAFGRNVVPSKAQFQAALEECDEDERKSLLECGGSFPKRKEGIFFCSGCKQSNICTPGLTHQTDGNKGYCGTYSLVKNDEGEYIKYAMYHRSDCCGKTVAPYKSKSQCNACGQRTTYNTYLDPDEVDGDDVEFPSTIMASLTDAETGRFKNYLKSTVRITNHIYPKIKAQYEALPTNCSMKKKRVFFDQYPFAEKMGKGRKPAKLGELRGDDSVRHALQESWFKENPGKSIIIDGECITMLRYCKLVEEEDSKPKSKTILSFFGPKKTTK